ncbi:MAG: ATP-binding protein, partial [Gammaproteobacteria bacterium]
LTLTLNELLTNAVKHAFPGDRFGMITVSARVTMTGPPEQPLELKLQVADDGVGLPQGFDLARATGLGARIVARLVRQLAGQIALEPAPTGTRWALRLPLATH